MNLRYRWRDLVEGIRNGYPLCCVLRFSLCRWEHQAVHRGVISDHRGGFVACGIFHKGEPWQDAVAERDLTLRYGEATWRAKP